MDREEINKIFKEGNLIISVVTHEGKTKFEYKFKGRTWIEDNQLTNEEIINKTE